VLIIRTEAQDKLFADGCGHADAAFVGQDFDVRVANHPPILVSYANAVWNVRIPKRFPWSIGVRPYGSQGVVITVGCPALAKVSVEHKHQAETPSRP
jgi:hypothetical protein